MILDVLKDNAISLAVTAVVVITFMIIRIKNKMK